MESVDIHKDFLIRHYSEEDYDEIVRLWELTDLGNPERDDSRNTIKRTIEMGGCLLVMETKSNGQICGTSWMTTDGRRIMLHHFGILPEYQGNGLSKILLKKSLQFVKEKGHQVKLEVHSTNLKAINLYKKSGFVHLGEYNVYIIRDISKI
ncbi:MAG: GNAT family N-acetyltransferase [Bacteroidetes bacterium]|nr:MAG: GNAT family N-acetyltransferase [Bacteroidota bacterium]